MTRTTTPRTRTPKHDPDCPGDHTRDFTCDEADRLDGEQRLPASWNCPFSPSRTEPDHRFDFSEHIPDDETECVNGCGMTWDRLRGVE